MAREISESENEVKSRLISRLGFVKSDLNAMGRLCIKNKSICKIIEDISMQVNSLFRLLMNDLDRV